MIIGSPFLLSAGSDGTPDRPGRHEILRQAIDELRIGNVAIAIGIARGDELIHLFRGDWHLPALEGSGELFLGQSAGAISIDVLEGLGALHAGSLAPRFGSGRKPEGQVRRSVEGRQMGGGVKGKGLMVRSPNNA